MNLEQHILEVEREYAQLFYTYCRDIFNRNHIPSHDHKHHWRVWEFAKQLLSAAPPNTFSKSDVEALLTASLFHDTGLSIDIGKQHGQHSALIFRNFIFDNQHLKTSNTEKITEAIVNHDNKEGQQLNSPFSLTAMLTTCDDLDAFGYLGVYRYLEIYLMRSTPSSQLGTAILYNIKKRFENFEKLYSNLEPFYTTHNQRYFTTKSIVESNELLSIARTIQDLAIEQQLAIDSVVSLNIGYTDKNSYFWNALQSELQLFSYPSPC